MIVAVIFDLDGVLLDSEQLWDRARRELVDERNGRWSPEATQDMQGMSSPEWSRYLHERLGVDLAPDAVNRAVVEKLLDHYRRELPLLPGAREAVRRLAGRWPLGLASSSNREVIDQALELAGLAASFSVTVSSEEVARGKPAPDVYLEVARRLRCPEERCAAVEDSANGLRSAAAAGMLTVVVPNAHFPPPPEVLATAGAVLDSLEDLTAERLESLAVDGRPPAAREARLDEQEMESFPASDSHSDWAGPDGRHG